MKDPAQIRVDNLCKYYGNVKAVDGISFQVEEAAIFGMLGPNGAGKTTTIETIIGLLDKTGGKIELLGLDPSLDLPELRKKIGVQLQNPALFPRLTVGETLDLFASFYPNPLDLEVTLELVGLTGSKRDRIDSLSGGQKHRMAVALAIVSNGDIVFLDEPTTGLDPQARRQLWEVISNLSENGDTVFLTTHYMEEAETLCHQLVIIDQGKIIAEGSPKNLIQQHFKQRAIDFTNPGFTEQEKEKMQAILGSDLEYNEEENQLIIYSEQIANVYRKLIEFAEELEKPIHDLVIRQATLEDVFLKLTGRGIRNE